MAFLIDDLILWIGERIKTMTDEELYGSKEKVYQELLALQAKLDMGKMTEEEYHTKEKQILERLKLIQEREEEEKNEP